MSICAANSDEATGVRAAGVVNGAGAPTLLASSTAPNHHQRGYRRDYRVHGSNGLCQLQRVRVHIRYRMGACLLADYRHTYYEFFQFESEQDSVIDTHDFDVVRDGWRQSLIRSLVQRHRDRDSSPLNGEPILSVKKQFTIAAGVVRGGKPTCLSSGSRFGCLTRGPSGPSRSRLRIARGDGSWRRIGGLPHGPTGYRLAGSAAFATTIGFRAFEHLQYRFARLHAQFADRGGYRHQAINSQAIEPRANN